MTKIAETNALRAEGIQTRIAELAERHGQAEIARKTEFSSNNVSRYIRGTRTPIEFGAAVVEGLGVNPAWLLTGEGTPYLSDVSTDTQKMAGDLLALVKSMQAVSRMRLGSLVGKHHLAVLRELNDALGRYETLRAELNERSEEIFRELVDRINETLETPRWKENIPQTADLCAAAEQVGRFSENTELHTQLHAAQAVVDFATGENESGLEHQRRAYLNSMLQHAGYDLRVQMMAHNYARLLMRNHRLDEARRVAGAAVAMAGGEGPQLETVIATVDVETGNLARGLSELRRLRSMLDMPYVHRAVDPPLLSGQVLEGSLSIGEAYALAGEYPQVWVRLLRSAFVLESRDDLQLLLDNAPFELEIDTALPGWAACTLETLISGKPAKSFKETPAPAKRASPVDHFEYHTWAAQLYRLAGNKTQAKKQLNAATEDHAKIPQHILPPMEWRIIHARNHLELNAPDDPDRTQAETFLHELQEKGYRRAGDARTPSQP